MAHDDDVDLIRLLRDPKPRSRLYLDMSHDSGAPPQRDHQRLRHAHAALQKAGAPASDLDVLEDVLATPLKVANPVARYLVLDGGEVVVDEVLPGPPEQADTVGHGAVLDVVPLLRHRRALSAYMIVEAGRDGGRIRIYGTRGAAAPLHSEDTVGRTDSLAKVRAGGWSNARYQNHTEEIWKHNETELAGEVDALVRRHRPRLLLLAGDVRAVQLLEGRLSAESRSILSTLSTYTRPAGASDKQLRTQLIEQLRALADAERSAALNRLGSQHTKEGPGAQLGVGPVVSALQQGQADTVLIDMDALGEHPLLALESEPWVATAPENAHGSGVLESVPAAVALVRAAMLTDADVIFTDGHPLPGGVAVAAVLRWPVGPPTP